MNTDPSRTDFLLSAVTALLLVLPFIVLEFANTGGFTTAGFPVSVFVALWLLSFAFLVGVTGFIKQLRSGAVSSVSLSMVLRAAFMIAIAVMWYGVVSDQMPCFMGVPNCD